MRPKLIVLLVVLVLVIGGGITALILLTRPSEADAPGRYHSLVENPKSCSSLSDSTFGFTTIATYPRQDGTTAQQCFGMAPTPDNIPVVDVFREDFPDPGSVNTAQSREQRSDGTPLSGTGFENDPYVGYTSRLDPYDSEKIDDCTVEYRRSNEWIKLDFSYLPGVSDLASCRKLVVPYAQPFYASIG
jgi:hypothetical protein